MSWNNRASSARTVARQAGAVLAVAISLACTAWSGSTAAEFSTVEEIVTYQGPDREARLIETAKKEGSVTLYTNAPSPDNKALVEAFEKKYGIKVNAWRAGSEEITQRIIAENQAKRFSVDVALNNGPALEALHREGMLQPVTSPYIANILPSAIPPHKEWVGFCYNVLLAMYNTGIVDKADLPKTYADLTDPKWKGKLGIEADDSDWFAGLMTQMGEEKGVKLFRQIAATNGISVRKGHSLLANLVSAGEVPLALTVFSYTAQQAKDSGAPVDWFVIPPLIAMPNSIAVLKNAPHPAAAVLYFDFMLNEAQSSVLPSLNYVVSKKDVASPLDRDQLSVIDTKAVLDEGDKWRTTYAGAIAPKGE